MILRIIIASFSINDKARRLWFFEEILLIANISIDKPLRISFLILSNAKIYLLEQKLNWRSYIIVEILPIIKQVDLVRKKEFAVIIFDLNNNTFVVNIAFFISTHIYHFCKVLIALLIQNNTLIAILFKYADFTNIFFPNLVEKILEYTGVNKCFINLMVDHQPLYKPINSLKLVKLESLRYILKPI